MATARKIKYLDYFDTIEYDFSGKGDFNTIVDITKSVVIKDKFDSSRYLKYDIKDGERPDTVSMNLYNDPQYYWSIFLYNDSLRNGLSGWPLSNRQFDRMIEIEYNSYCFICPEPLPSTGLFGSNRYSDNNFLQTLPIDKKYYPHINIWVKNSSDDYQKTDLKISSYDSNRFGLILKKGENNYISDLGIGNKTVDFAYEPEALGTIYLEASSSELGQEWLESVNNLTDLGYILNGGYNIINENGATFIPVYYNIRLSQEFLRNAPYEYFTEDDNEQLLSLSHYDVVFNAINDQESTFPQEITYIEYERILNERKKSIIVPRKSVLSELTYQFKSLLDL